MASLDIPGHKNSMPFYVQGIEKPRNEMKQWNKMKQEATPKILHEIVAQLHTQAVASSVQGHKG